MNKVHDITIIGGGPVGLFAAFYAGMRSLSTHLIDSLPQLGGQLAELYPEKDIYDIAGLPKIKAGELVSNLIDQMKPFEPEIHLNETVQDLVKYEDGTFSVVTENGVYLSKTVLITAGIGAFTPRRLPVPQEENYAGKGIFYRLNDIEICRDRNVVVVGGGDSAVDFALMIEPIAKSVTLVHRRDQFRAHEETVKKLLASTVQVKTFFEVTSVHGNEWVTGVTLTNNRDKRTEERTADLIFSALGFTASLGPILNWGLRIEKNQIVVNSRMETNIPGIYAAGDIVTYEGKLKLIAVGFGEAPIAVNHAKAFIDPEAKVYPGHSSNREMTGKVTGVMGA